MSEPVSSFFSSFHTHLIHFPDSIASIVLLLVPILFFTMKNIKVKKYKHHYHHGCNNADSDSTDLVLPVGPVGDCSGIRRSELLWSPNHRWVTAATSMCYCTESSLRHCSSFCELETSKSHDLRLVTPDWLESAAERETDKVKNENYMEKEDDIKDRGKVNVVQMLQKIWISRCVTFCMFTQCKMLWIYKEL